MRFCASPFSSVSCLLPSALRTPAIPASLPTSAPLDKPQTAASSSIPTGAKQIITALVMNYIFGVDMMNCEDLLLLRFPVSRSIKVPHPHRRLQGLRAPPRRLANASKVDNLSSLAPVITTACWLITLTQTASVRSELTGMEYVARINSMTRSFLGSIKIAGLTT